MPEEEKTGLLRRPKKQSGSPQSRGTVTPKAGERFPPKRGNIYNTDNKIQITEYPSGTSPRRTLEKISEEVVVQSKRRLDGKRQSARLDHKITDIEKLWCRTSTQDI